MVSTSTGVMAKTSLSTTTYTPESSPEATTTTVNWTPCAAENETCSFSGEVQVRYGTATNFVIKALTGPVACSNAVFGDPAFGYAKSCSIGVAPVWAVCATEGNTCPVSGSTEVRYGTDTKYFSKTVTDSVACTNANFGDPVPDVVKSCKIDAQALAAAAAVPWTECATEGKTCSREGNFKVRYGTATQFITKTVTGSVTCSNASFGDPAPNQVKSCRVAASGSGLTTPQVTSPLPAPAPTPVPMPASVSGAITTVQLINPGSTAQSNAAATFGQAFAQGDIPKGSTLTGKLSNGSVVPVQVDAKARHPDGSLRHAVVTVQLPSLAAKQAETVGLVRDSTISAAAPTTPATLLANGFSASFNATIGGVLYSASADELLKSGKYTTWLSGPLAHEWMVAAPLKTASGTEHPHLHARFTIRSYPATNSARVDVTVENGWAFTAMPSNFTYDAQVMVGGQQVFAQAGLNHYSHARWRKVYWWGNAPKLDVRHNTAYLIASKAVANYDQSLVIRESTIATWNTYWTSGNTGPMQAGVGVPYMPTTGARADIGPMPTWNALYLLSMDQRMKNVALGMSELAGSWGAHYRNKQTGRPVTLAEFPYMSMLSAGNDTLNPATGKLEAFPECPQTRCATPMTVDTAHQPAFSYLPYLVTGDYYHLEELQFWANMSSFYSHTGERYRDAGKGLVKSDQIRGQAWTLRTLAEAAYITPDDDPQKANFTTLVNNNIDWFTNTFPNNPNANKLGVLDHDSYPSYLGGLGIAPWQDDFFTTTVGRMVELGFSKAQPLLVWKAKFVVDRIVGAGFCWIEASQYAMKVRDSMTTPLYSTIAEVYKANHTAAFSELACASVDMATSLGLRTGYMAGDFTPSGTQAIMQPALAYSARLNASAAQAWTKFATRPYQPDFANEPQYAIVPR
ncbi:hypothetical protein [Massilia alkalitolerans]|uniref:RIFT barrel domain-containing protein n=1 Tax=Massilia alkalitolerans TaxID=286638 RepID=UPI0028A7F267|nr:hypothetical protein [Massilia alkalitolerans]